jgi:N-methylhydantoinase A/oxoprolinase/acetone carboxylase beta subunit
VDDDLAGPAVVEEEGSTLVMGPSVNARVASSGNIIMTLPPARRASPEPSEA